jgi:alpha-L-fucosidase
LKSVKASSQTKISVLGKNDIMTEYKPSSDTKSKIEQREDGLNISIVRAQLIYNNHIRFVQFPKGYLH